MIQFKENTQTDGQKDGQTLFYRTLLATAGGPIDWAAFYVVKKKKNNFMAPFYGWVNSGFSFFSSNSKCFMRNTGFGVLVPFLKIKNVFSYF